MGNNIERIDNPKEDPASRVDTTGFAIPPVVVVDAALVTVVPVWTIPAAPLPAIIANAHFANGGNPLTTATIRMAPAINAAGVAIESSTLSSQGM